MMDITNILTFDDVMQLIVLTFGVALFAYVFDRIISFVPKMLKSINVLKFIYGGKK